MNDWDEDRERRAAAVAKFQRTLDKAWPIYRTCREAGVDVDFDDVWAMAEKDAEEPKEAKRGRKRKRD